jgi:hypothetical protein
MRYLAASILLASMLCAAGCSAPGLSAASDRAEDARAAQFSSVEEKKVPYIGVMNYPDNWPDISELRDRQAAAH